MANIAWYDTAQLKIIEKARKDENWFTAIVLSATQLERHGYLQIKEYLESLNIESELINRILNKATLRTIAGYLLLSNKIDEEDYEIIMKINAERNKFIHRTAEKEKFLRGKEAKDKYDPLVNESERILKEKMNVVRLFFSAGR